MTAGRASTGGRKKLTPFNKFMQTETARLKEEQPELDNKERCVPLIRPPLERSHSFECPGSEWSLITGTSRRKRCDGPLASCHAAAQVPFCAYFLRRVFDLLVPRPHSNSSHLLDVSLLVILAPSSVRHAVFSVYLSLVVLDLFLSVAILAVLYFVHSLPHIGSNIFVVILLRSWDNVTR